MSQKIILIIILVILLIGLASVGYIYLTKLKKSETPAAVNILKNAEEQVNKITEEATQGVLPSLPTNPLENKPDLNPATQANPIKNIKTNPFD